MITDALQAGVLMLVGVLPYQRLDGRAGRLYTFTAAARTGAYFRVVTSGTVGAGDRITVVRPEHDVTVSLVFQATTTSRDLLPLLLAVGDEPRLRNRQMTADRAVYKRF